MSGNEFNLRRVDQDFLLRGLEAQNVGDMAGGNGVEVRFKLNEPIGLQTRSATSELS